MKDTILHELQSEVKFSVTMTDPVDIATLFLTYIAIGLLQAF